ncbi:MAG: hypothetical protein M1549_01920 [Candidatus Dependentiae bacterium]|nr:hypothetical protein [Candidatus Dependentiae bacterium]
MKRKALDFLLCFGFLLSFSGCNRYLPWFKKQFKEAERCEDREYKAAHGFIRRAPAYQPFSWRTLDILYALPINELVTRVADRISCCCIDIPKTDQRSERREIKAGQTRFYIMMDSQKEDWCFVLSVHGDRSYRASSIKSRVFARGIKGILGEYARFKKNSFEIAFDTVVGERACDLIASNGSYTVTMSWESFEA